jgi:hypothetical protein
VIASPAVSSAETAGFRAAATSTARRLLLGAAAGGWAGLLIGGVGGRLAMFVLRLTSPQSVRGMRSDDGFTIGVVSTETLFLLLLTTAVGIVGGALFVAARAALPARRRTATWGLVGGAVGGSLILHGDGVDFTRLEPRSLAIAMFVAIPAGGAALTAHWATRWAPWWAVERRRTILAALPLGVTVALFPMLIVGTAVVLAVAACASIGPVREIVARAGPTVGRAALAVVIVLSSLALFEDLRDIL